MASRKNHHYVPQFYFRQFSGGQNCIQAFFPGKRRFIENAPIKGQCFKEHFHGDDEAEKQIGKLEANQSIALRAIIAAASEENPISAISHIDLALATQAVSMMKHRTFASVRKSAVKSSELMLESFKGYAKSKLSEDDYQKFLIASRNGDISIEQSEPGIALLNISMAMIYAELITDLDFCLVRNRTDLPFIFCDSPVIFHNTYCHNVKHRGVLGMATPGLQIFFPLNSRLLMLLYDEDKYQCDYSDSAGVDIINKFDVSQLNALQLHAHDRAVYFANFSDMEYVEQLWMTHGPNRIKQERFLIKHDDWLLDGEPVKGLLHQFEHLLNIRLDLSFLHCDPIREEDFEPKRRNPELVRVVDERMNREFDEAKKRRKRNK